MSPRFIALEEHFYSKAIFDSLGEPFQRTLNGVPGLADKLRDVGHDRLAAMDSGDISLQIVSHAFTPGGPSASNCQSGNDELADKISKSGDPERFRAFAVLPCGDATGSATELERAVSCLGFVGALIDNHANGKHFESPSYDVLWAKACDLDVPIYLHPTWPGPVQAGYFMGDYPLPVGISLGGPGWGWHGDVGLHVLKLFCAGVFDRFPKLKIIIGHFGEQLPFMLERCIDMSTRWGAGWGQHDRPLGQVWDENIWITTSGAWSLAPIKCILENTRLERIMYSVDYPFESNDKARGWFEKLEASGILTSEQLELIANGNAKKLLKLSETPDTQ